MSNKLDTALALLKRGYAVFPCRVLEKRPATWRGFLDASKEESQIREWFTDSHKNIGIATGQASGVAVIDFDYYKVQEDKPSSLQLLAERLGTLPQTRAVRTRAGGLHLYFKYPEGRDLRSYNGQIIEHVDLRANGGYVLSEGCEVNADKNGPYGEHRLVCDCEPATLPAAWVYAWEALNARQDALAAKKKAKEAALTTEKGVEA